jgi:hypothetical protein
VKDSARLMRLISSTLRASSQIEWHARSTVPKGGIESFACKPIEAYTAQASKPFSAFLRFAAMQLEKATFSPCLLCASGWAAPRQRFPRAFWNRAQSLFAKWVRFYLVLGLVDVTTRAIHSIHPSYPS